MTMSEVEVLLASIDDRENRIREIRASEHHVTGLYRHYKGGLYAVDGLVAREVDASCLVIYRSADGIRFARPLIEFQQRFERVEEAG